MRTTLKYIVIILAAILFSVPIMVKNNKSNKIIAEQPAASISAKMIYTEEAENTNSLLPINTEYVSAELVLKDGTVIPDIMSEKIMKSDYREITVIQNGEETVRYASGPKIVINEKEIPADSFYAEGDYLNNEFYYVICPECFKDCGFEPNYDIVLTPYDEACLIGNHTYTILCDELEIHTTWEIEKYDAENNTYYFSVTQEGPFSGTSDIFSVYVNGERMNTMPAKGSIHGSVLTEYDKSDKYWHTLGYNRDDYRYMLDSKYGTKIGRLPYKQDFP